MILFQAMWIMLVTCGFLTFLGLSPALLLGVGPWKPYRVAMAPFVGLILAIIISYYLNLLFPVNLAFWVLVCIGLLGNGLVVWKMGYRWRNQQWKHLAFVSAMAAGLFCCAIIPHVKEQSLSLLALNVDEAFYWPYAEQLKHYPSNMQGALASPFLDDFTTAEFRSRGHGFSYLIALMSIATGQPTILTYMPVLYSMLGLSVIAVFLFARVGLQLNGRTSMLGAALYSLNGLPLWFSGMGFGPHATSFALLPLALASVVVAMRTLNGRAALMAGGFAATLLTSYFWGISVLFLIVGTTIVVGLFVGQGRKLESLKISLVMFTAGVVLAFPGLFWLAMWSLPKLGDIYGNTGGLFGNAWGDLSFPPMSMGMGLEAYHMVHDGGLWDRLLGSSLADLISNSEVIWWALVGLWGIALVAMRGDRLAAGLITVSFLGFMYLVKEIMGYPYGHLKNLSYLSFLSSVLVSAGVMTLRERSGDWRIPLGIFPLNGKLVSRIATIICLMSALLMVRNTFQTGWWYWRGFSWNLPHSIVEDSRFIAQQVEPGAVVEISPRAGGHIVPIEVKMRPITLAFHFVSQAVSHTEKRVAAVVATELSGRKIHAPGGVYVHGVGPEFGRMDIDYLVLGASEDPRLYGLLESENLAPGRTLGLYKYPHIDVLTSEELAEARFSADVSARRGLVVSANSSGLKVGTHEQISRSDASAQILMGLVNPTGKKLDYKFGIGEDSESDSLAPGMNWIITDRMSMPFEAEFALSEGRARVGVIRLLRQPTVEAVSGLDSRAVVFGEAKAVDNILSLKVWFVNPGRMGKNVGIVFEDVPARADPTNSSRIVASWGSEALAGSDLQELEIEYEILTGSLQQSYKGDFISTRISSPGTITGNRRFVATYRSGHEHVATVILCEYRMVEGRPQITKKSLTPQLFVLRDY
tara:strand:- start:182 stop:2950 length:2769 start_codon:yes stop_codon:yes gene_type:complete